MDFPDEQSKPGRGRAARGKYLRLGYPIQVCTARWTGAPGDDVMSQTLGGFFGLIAQPAKALILAQDRQHVEDPGRGDAAGQGGAQGLGDGA